MKGFKMQVLLTVALLCAAGTVQANWVTIDFPGATGTYPQGIYGNRIVGYYEDGAGDYHGFLYEGADWTTLDAPDAIDTRSFGIDGDNIVGWYQDPAGWHGFLCDGTSWQTVDVPGAHSTMAYGIDGANIVGLYDGKGFLYDGSNWTTLVFPGASYTHISDIDGHTMVGVYSVFYAPEPQTPYGFFYDGTTWTPLPEGDLVAWTLPTGIDEENIVGLCRTPETGGFLYDGTTWTTIDYPGSSSTIAEGIDEDKIVGRYYDGSRERGFIYTIPEPGTVLLLGLAGLRIVRRRRDS